MTAVESNDNGEFMIDNSYHLDTYNNSSCMDDDCINHNLTCVGEELYCNYTYDEYVEMLYDYIYPSVSEWILIFSHAVVFFMGLVSIFRIKNCIKLMHTLSKYWIFLPILRLSKHTDNDSRP